MEHPFVTIVILNWNGYRHLDRLLPSLEKQCYPRDRYEILFADNASTDESVEYVKNNFPNIRIEELGKNFGFAGGNNLAVERAHGTLIAFLNNDTEADPDWLVELVRAHQQYPKALLSSQAYQFSNRDVSANSLTKLTAWGIPVNVNVFKPRSMIQPKICRTFYADAAGMLISRAIFTKLKGFDTKYFAYEEEKDLSWRAWLSGYPSYWVPKSVYYHKGGATLGQHSPEATYLLWRNGLYNMVKYLSGKRLFSSLVLHFFYSVTSFMVFFLPKRKWGLLKAMLKAYATAIFEAPRLFRERHQCKKRIYQDKDFLSMGLTLSLIESLRLVFQFLARRKNHINSQSVE